jgi:hypothetical protein
VTEISDLATLPYVDAALDDRGLEVVRMLMVNLSRNGVVMTVDAGGGVQVPVTRADAEAWIKRKEIEQATISTRKEAEAARRDTIRFCSMLALTAVGAVAAIVAA